MPGPEIRICFRNASTATSVSGASAVPGFARNSSAQSLIPGSSWMCPRAFISEKYEPRTRWSLPSSYALPRLDSLLIPRYNLITQKSKPDVIVGLITTQLPKELAPTDCELRDWRDAGLHQPSFFRLFPVTLLQREVCLSGQLSGSNCTSVRACLKAGFGSDWVGADCFRCATWRIDNLPKWRRPRSWPTISRWSPRTE
jgi:hypothetical protein